MSDKAVDVLVKHVAIRACSHGARVQSLHTRGLHDAVCRWFTLIIALHMFVCAVHAAIVRRADTESRMSVTDVGLHDSKDLPHDCVQQLHVFVRRARLNFPPIDS